MKIMISLLFFGLVVLFTNCQSENPVQVNQDITPLAKDLSYGYQFDDEANPTQIMIYWKSFSGAKSYKVYIQSMPDALREYCEDEDITQMPDYKKWYQAIMPVSGLPYEFGIEAYNGKNELLTSIALKFWLP